MDEKQIEEYGKRVDEWKKAAASYGKGWDEDDPEIPVDYMLDVDMVGYHLGGLFKVFDGKRAHMFSNPKVDILARVQKVKAHMNRMISSVEFAREELQTEGDAGHAIPIWDLVRRSVERLHAAHHGWRYRVQAESIITTKLKGHATGLPSTLPWHCRFGYDRVVSEPQGDGDAGYEDAYELWLRTTVFTVCPFVLYETDGRQSHTQRSHVEVTIRATDPILPGPIMREITGRLVPVMSNMKIPDEVIQVLKAYAGPTFTEDATVRVIKILRGITAEFVPDGDVLNCTARVISEDSHLAHDIVTTAEDNLQ